MIMVLAGFCNDEARITKVGEPRRSGVWSPCRESGRAEGINITAHLNPIQYRFG